MSLILNLSASDWVFKAGPSLPAPGGGGGGGGPGGSPRPGHKYVKRTWAGDHWEYEYAEDRHANHDIGAMHEQEHTLDLPAHITSDKHTPEQAYLASRNALLETPGKKGVIKHPQTGEEHELHVVKDASGKHVLMLHRPGEAQPLETFKNMGNLERWMRIEKETHHVYDANGNKLYSVVPNVGVVNKEGVLVPRKAQDKETSVFDRGAPRKITNKADRLAWKVVYHPGTPQHDPTKKENIAYYASKDVAVARAEKLKNELASTDAHKDTAGVKASDIIAKHGSATKALLSGELPTEAYSTPVVYATDEAGNPMYTRDGKRLVKEKTRSGKRIKFASPEEREAFVSQLIKEHSDRLDQVADNVAKKLGIDVDHVRAKMTGDGAYGPGSIAHHSISRVLDRFDPAKVSDGGKEFANYIGTRAYYDSMGQIARDPSVGASAQARAKTESDSGGDEDYGQQRSRRQGGMSEEERGEESALERIDAQRQSEKTQTGGLDNWKKEQTRRLSEWGASDPALTEFANQMSTTVGQINSPEMRDQFLNHMVERVVPYLRKQNPSLANHFAMNVLHQDIGKAHAGLADLQKAIREAEAVALLKSDLAKAKPIPLTNHEYDHMEGGVDHPNFFYRDPKGNIIRYTNAPSGHSDFSDMFGDPAPHYTEPMFEKNPEFFTPDGRKLTRAPHPQAEMQWNPNYHPEDPKNLWAGRWVNPVSGEHEYTYIDADIRNQPKLCVHLQNALVDVRLPYLRRYMRDQLHSKNIKDQIVAVMVMLLDQGRFRALELATLTPSDVEFMGPLVRLGQRVIHADQKMQSALLILKESMDPSAPLFSVPKVSVDGSLDPAYLRRIGPHFLALYLDELGVPLEALQRYHANQTFSQAFTKIILKDDVSIETALHYALLYVASEMGVVFGEEPDVITALALVQAAMIDPVLVEVLEKNAREMGLGASNNVISQPFTPAIVSVSADLADRTPAEKEFSKYLHTYAAHNHVEASL